MNNFKLVNLLEPDLCLDCRFATIAEVTDTNGRTRLHICCTRRDCDNWDRSTAQPITHIRFPKLPHNPFQDQ